MLTRRHSVNVWQVPPGLGSGTRLERNRQSNVILPTRATTSPRGARPIRLRSRSMTVDDLVTVRVHHFRGALAPCSNEGALSAFIKGAYRCVGEVRLRVWECAPSHTLMLAWAKTQNLNGRTPWSARTRSTRPGDILSVGGELYVVHGRNDFAFIGCDGLAQDACKEVRAVTNREYQKQLIGLNDELGTLSERIEWLTRVLEDRVDDAAIEIRELRRRVDQLDS